MVNRGASIKLTRWSGGKHPTASAIIHALQAEGLRPFTWRNNPNTRYAVRSHNYDTVLFVIRGSLEITLPDRNQRTKVGVGDRVDIPAGLRHGKQIGNGGVVFIEAVVRPRDRWQA